MNTQESKKVGADTFNDEKAPVIATYMSRDIYQRYDGARAAPLENHPIDQVLRGPVLC